MHPRSSKYFGLCGQSALSVSRCLLQPPPPVGEPGEAAAQVEETKDGWDGTTGTIDQ